MANKNIASPTAAKIFAAWELERGGEKPRGYLGSSIVGHECEMYLWLYFRGVRNERFDGRMYRLFDRGKREEAVFCDDLRRIGCEVKEFDENGRQFSVSALGDHFAGHLDGVVRGLPESPNEWHVVEFKTHSDSSFKKLCKEGVQKAKPTHYAQMMTYMGLTGLKSALYMAVDKDDDNLWVERIKFSQTDYDSIMARAKTIIDTATPIRCANRRDDFRCKACPIASVCWHDAETFVDSSIPETCRTCCHATAVTDKPGAMWSCRLGHPCSPDGTCGDYLILPAFVNGEVVEGDDNGILYSFEVDGKTDGITIGKRGFSVTEAKKFGPRQAREVKIARELSPTASVSASTELEKKYADESKYSTYFKGSVKELGDWISKTRIADFTKPVLTETLGRVQYFEYAPSTLVRIEGDRAEVRFECPPF